MDEKRYNSKKQEQKVAKEISGKTTPASGALWGAKADVRNDKFLVECKTTNKDFYKLSATIWQKIMNEALHDGMRIPVMCIDLNNGNKRLSVMLTSDLDTELKPKTDTKYKAKSVTIKEPCNIGFMFGAKKGFIEISVIDWNIFIESVLPKYGC